MKANSCWIWTSFTDTNLQKMVVWAFTLKITATELQQFDSTIQRKGVKWNSYIMMVFGAKNFTNVWLL